MLTRNVITREWRILVKSVPEKVFAIMVRGNTFVKRAKETQFVSTIKSNIYAKSVKVMVYAFMVK